MSEEEVRNKIYDWFLEKTNDKSLAMIERDSLDSTELLEYLCKDSFMEVTETDIDCHCIEMLSAYSE